MVGVGKIGEAILRGLIDSSRLPAAAIRGSVRREQSIARVRDSLGIAVGLSNSEAVRDADIVVLAVKPQIMGEVLTEIAPAIQPGALVISVAASVRLSRIERELGGERPVIRAMPNTPCLVGAGMTVLAPGRFAGDAGLAIARELFETCGEVAILAESHMDAVTGLSGSGPAYIYTVIESLAEAGVKVGIPRDAATLLSAQTVLGAARMVLDRKEHPALLRDGVTTPAGCTVDGLMELEEGKLRVTLLKAVVKATERAAQLSPEE